MSFDVRSIHHRRMARYRRLPTVPCAACGKLIRIGTRRLYEPTMHGTIALHPKCATSPIAGEPLRRATLLAVDVSLAAAAAQLLAALDAREHVDRGRPGFTHLRIVAEHLARRAARAIERAREG